MKRRYVTHPIGVNEFTVIPLETETVDRIDCKQGLIYCSSRSVTGVVIISGGCKQALKPDGTEIDLSTIIEKYEGLFQILENL